jgi:hypothetical protein
MNPETHFLFPFVIASVLAKLNIISWKLVLLCGLIGLIIDLDHYLEHVFHSKSNRFSFKAAWNNSIKFHRFSQRSFIHHWQGFLILSIVFLILSFFYWKIAFVIAIGYYSHLILDYVHLKKNKTFNWKLGKLYMKESYFEFVLDIILIVMLIVIYLL